MTSQGLVRTNNAKTVNNYSTNGRMLKYRQIHQNFFMDTFFASNKEENSSQGHTCYQLFVTDVGFVYVVPMRSKMEVLKAVNRFAK